MSYKCKLCDLLITWDDLLNPEWCCGRCTFDDYEEVKTVNEDKERWCDDYRH